MENQKYQDGDNHGAHFEPTYSFGQVRRRRVIIGSLGVDPNVTTSWNVQNEVFLSVSVSKAARAALLPRHFLNFVGGYQVDHRRKSKSLPVISNRAFVLVASVSGSLNQLGDFRRFGNVDSVAPGRFHHLCFGAPRHCSLGWRRNHLVFSCN
jgi:hypothetical protein